MARNPEFEKLFKQFKREVEREGIIREVKSREYYEKPSQIRRRKKMKKYRPQVQFVRRPLKGKGKGKGAARGGSRGRR